MRGGLTEGLRDVMRRCISRFRVSRQQQPADVSKSVSVSVSVSACVTVTWTALHGVGAERGNCDWSVATTCLLNRMQDRSKSISCQVSGRCQVCECEGGEGEGDSSGVRNVIISLSSLFTIQIKKLAMVL